jgi:glycogen synthase
MSEARATELRRVLMTSDTVGGVWSFALELAAAWRRLGIEVHVATMGPLPSAAQRAEAASVPGLWIHSATFELEWMDDPWESVERAGAWLLDLDRRVRPDLVHLNGYVHATLPWSAPVVLTAHSCVRSWWSAVHGEDAPAAFDAYTARVRAGLAAARIVTAPTRAMLDAVDHHYGTPREGRVIPNGRSAERFRPAEKDQVLLAVGRVWDAAKNVAAVDRAAARLPWRVRVAGEPRHPTGGQAPLRNALALGSLDGPALAREYAHAAIFVLPALYEPFGLSALEAGLSGCALVLGDISSLREVWEDAACWVPPRDDEALVETLRRLVDRPGERIEYARRALERARRYTSARTAAGYLDAYRSARRDARSTPELAAAR